MRPKIICHMMASIDGKIVVERWTTPYNGTEKNSLVKAYGIINNEINAQGIVEGRKTVQLDFCPGKRTINDTTPVNVFKNFIGNRSEQFFIVLDPQGKINYQTDNIREKSIITVLGEDISEEYLSCLRDKGISYLFAGHDGKDILSILPVFKQQFHIETLLLQGGEIINGSFLKLGIIDEISLMLYPGLDGLSDIPGIFDYRGNDKEFPAAGQSLELLSCKTLEYGIVWLRYKVHINNLK